MKLFLQDFFLLMTSFGIVYQLKKYSIISNAWCHTVWVLNDTPQPCLLSGLNVGGLLLGRFGSNSIFIQQ